MSTDILNVFFIATIYDFDCSSKSDWSYTNQHHITPASVCHRFRHNCGPVWIRLIFVADYRCNFEWNLWIHVFHFLGKVAYLGSDRILIFVKNPPISPRPQATEKYPIPHPDLLFDVFLSLFRIRIESFYLFPRPTQTYLFEIASQKLEVVMRSCK